jgi:hypothetical protein
VLVYLSADWSRTQAVAAAVLPARVVMDTFTDDFPGGRDQYRLRLRDYAADLDVLLVFGTRISDRAYLLRSGARAELRTVGTGLPILLLTPPTASPR